MPECDKDHRYEEIFTTLPDDQGGTGRHKCAGCAYEEGYRQGLKRTRQALSYEELPNSQAGTVRHKSPEAAYELGYSHGVRDSKNTKSKFIYCL